jgi:hypothetical protein
MPQRKKHASTRARRNKAPTAATLTPAEPVDRAGWTAAQLRAEIDVRNQERAEDERLSKAGGKAGMLAALEDDDLSVPQLPDRPPFGWHEMTEQWWRDVWSSPMSAEWHPESDWHNVLLAAMHYDDTWRAPDAAQRQKATTLFVKMCEPLGLNPYARRRLEWTIESAAEARERGQARRGKTSGQPAPAPPPAGASDPRAQLHAVK